MATHEENPVPAPVGAEETMFRDLRARNERRRALRAPHAEHKRRVERAIEAARAHARLAKPFHRRPSRPSGD